MCLKSSYFIQIAKFLLNLKMGDKMENIIRSIAMLEPKNENMHIYSKFELPRLGCVLLATIMKNLGFEARAYFLSERKILEKNITADVIGISSISSTAFIAYRLGDYFRSKGKIVVMGGPHITALPEEAMEHCDYCICGEGEKCLPQLIEALNQNQNLEYVRSFPRLLSSVVPARANFEDYATILQQQFGATSNIQASGMINNRQFEVTQPILCGMFLQGEAIPLGTNGTGGLQIKLQLSPSIEIIFLSLESIFIFCP